MKINRKILFIIGMVLLVVPLVNATLDFPCPGIGEECSENTDCCPVYLTSHGRFNGYCSTPYMTEIPLGEDNFSETCQPATGIDGRMSERDICGGIVEEYSWSGVDSNKYKYYHEGQVNIGQYPSDGWLEVNFLGWDYNKAVALRNNLNEPYGLLSVCDVVYQGGVLYREIEPTDSLENDLHYYYDVDGGLKKITYQRYDPSLGDDPEDFLVNYFDYMGIGKSLHMSDSVVSGLEINSVDSVGNLLEKRLENGIVLRNFYDGYSRLRSTISIKPGVGTETITYNYPYWVQLDEQFYDEYGCSDAGSGTNVAMLCSVEYSSGSTSFHYDERGQMTERTIMIEGLTEPYVLDYTYNDGGSIDTLKLPDNSIISYVYDSMGRLKELEHNGVKLVGDFSYNPTGTIDEKTLNPDALGGNDILVDYTYNAREFLTSLSYGLTNPGDLFQRSMRYDAVGNILQIGNERNPEGDLDFNKLVESYTYDYLDRLDVATYDPSGQNYFIDYDYLNTLGDRNLMTSNAPGLPEVVTYNYWYPVEDFSKVRSVDIEGVGKSGAEKSYTYDEVGNVIKIEGESVIDLEYDALNRMTKSIVDGVVEEYVYDYTNKRVKKITSSGTTFYIYQGNNVIYEEEFEGEVEGDCTEQYRRAASGWSTTPGLEDTLNDNACCLNEGEGIHEGDDCVLEGVCYIGALADWGSTTQRIPDNVITSNKYLTCANVGTPEYSVWVNVDYSVWACNAVPGAQWNVGSGNADVEPDYFPVGGLDLSSNYCANNTADNPGKTKSVNCCCGDDEGEYVRKKTGYPDLCCGDFRSYNDNGVCVTANCNNPDSYTCGNVDGDSGGSIDISDLVYLVDYMFTGGPEPPLMCGANVDGDSGGSIDISDLVYLVDYMFTGGPAPPEICYYGDSGQISNPLIGPDGTLWGLEMVQTYIQAAAQSGGEEEPEIEPKPEIKSKEIITEENIQTTPEVQEETQPINEEPIVEKPVESPSLFKRITEFFIGSEIKVESEIQEETQPIDEGPIDEKIIAEKEVVVSEKVGLFRTGRVTEGGEGFNLLEWFKGLF